jgi:hypothetical protein
MPCNPVTLCRDLRKHGELITLWPHDTLNKVAL